MMLQPAPAKMRSGGLLARCIGFVSLKYKEHKEKKELHPIRLQPADVEALHDLAAGAHVSDISLATLRIEREGGEPRIVHMTTIAYFQKIGFVRQNGAGQLVVTDRGRAAARLASKPGSRLRADAETDAAELVRKELFIRVGRHEKWLSGAMGGKQLGVRFADLEDAQLPGRNLAQVQLEGCLLGGANLAKADLSGASLQGCDLTRADLRNARLRSADLRGCDFTDARLDGADLSGARFGLMRAETLEGFRQAHARAVAAGRIAEGDEPLPESLAARFDGARLAGCDLRGADLAQASFRSAVLTGADMRDTKIGGCDFAHADVSGARFAGAVMREANFALATGVADHAALRAAGANLGIRPERHMLAHILEANRLWYEANANPGPAGAAKAGARAVLAHMNLSDMDLRGASLAGADLREANLSGADLREAVLIHADLRGANVAGALFEGADLRMARPPAGSAGS